MPEISVIVPVYKVEKYINKCVDSILDQSFQDFDLILVDDGSPDACPQICDDYAARDNRITVIHKENGGLSDARNAGIDWAMEHSSSEWLAFVDSDDYLHPDYLKTMYDTAMKEDADLVICDYIRVNDQGEDINEEHGFCNLVIEDKRQLFEKMYTNWRIVPAWNKLYHKHIFSELRFAFGKIHEDEFAIHHVLWNCKRAAFIPQGLYYYLIRDNGIMNTKTPKSVLDGVEAMLELYEFGIEQGILPSEERISMAYLEHFTSRSMNCGKQERLRSRALKKRFSRLYFSCKSNRSLKRFIGFYFPRLYSMRGLLLGNKKIVE